MLHVHAHARPIADTPGSGLKSTHCGDKTHEALALVPVAWLLFHWRNRGRPDRVALGVCLVLADRSDSISTSSAS